MPTVPLLFLKGLPDNNLAEIAVDDQGQVAIGLSGCARIVDFLPPQAPVREQLVLGGASGQEFHLSPNPCVVFNGISDPDSHRLALLRANTLCEGLGDRALSVLNAPQRVLLTSRDQVAESLRSVPGVHAPPCHRIRPRRPVDVLGKEALHSLKPPLLFREAGRHNSQVELLRDESDLDVLHAHPLDGREFYVTSFVDYRSPDGFYRKYRLLVVDGRAHLRHLIASRDWLIHSVTRSEMIEYADLVREEREALRTFADDLGPRLQDRVTQIAQLLGLDYFGIDFALLPEEEMLVFEANPNMDFRVRSGEWPNDDAYRDVIQRVATDVVAMLKRHGASIV